MPSKSIEEQKKAARNTNELLDHLIRIIEQNDERFSFEWLVGGERAMMRIFDKEKKISYSVKIEPIEYDENVEAVINKRNLRIGGLKMGKEISRDDAVKMANWWAEQIIHPDQNMGTKEQSGNEMANILGTLLACKAVPNEEQVERFKNKLVDIIIEKKVNSLEVDYNPDIYLFEAAKYANIDCNCFPWKSRTYVRDNGQIIAKRGYGSSGERI